MTPHADTIIHHVHCFTANPDQSKAKAIAIKERRIVYVGDESGALEWKGENTKVIDGMQHTLMPGFIDSHFHLQHGSLELEKIHFETCFDYEDTMRAIRSFAAENVAAPWLSGFGLRYNLGPDHSPLTRQALDAIIADRPIAITAYDGHTMWINSLGLRMAGIFNGAECPPNSEVVLDEHGEATGELKERASQFITSILPVPDRATKLRLIKKGIQIAASMGITSIHNMDGEREQAELYAELEREGELNVRVYLPFSIRPDTPLESIGVETQAMKSICSSELLRSGCVKLFMDGVIETYTGLLVDPYADNPSTCGESNYSIEQYNRFVEEADRLGLQIFTHSVGDGGVRRVLNAYERAQKVNGVRDSRHRVEHIELIHPLDLPRFQELGVIASMQPLHSPASIDDGDIWPSRVGEQRWPLSFAWSDVRKAGAHLIFGSDWPVVTQNPLMGVHNTLNRQSWADGMPNHHQSLDDTLFSYTTGGAFAEYQEGVKGQLKPGYLADLVLLSEDIFAIPGEQMKEVHPVMTMLGGKITYED